MNNVQGDTYIDKTKDRSAAKKLGALPFVDANRIGIWGWSFGGHMAAMLFEMSFGLIEEGASRLEANGNYL